MRAYVGLISELVALLGKSCVMSIFGPLCRRQQKKRFVPAIYARYTTTTITFPKANTTVCFLLSRLLNGGYIFWAIPKSKMRKGILGSGSGLLHEMG